MLLITKHWIICFYFHVVVIIYQLYRKPLSGALFLKITWHIQIIKSTKRLKLLCKSIHLFYSSVWGFALKKGTVKSRPLQCFVNCEYSCQWVMNKAHKWHVWLTADKITSISLSLVSKLSPNTPIHLLGSGSSLFPLWRLLLDIGEWDRSLPRRLLP